ncbi:MAG TPA: amino acid permease, partial [bacterium]|nr:amino acid permease [bacterium]
GLGMLGIVAMLKLFLRAYCMGAGTYTGIEAVSNGLQIMREPKVETAKKTMTLMAISLAATAGGITLCYLLVHATPDPKGQQTMNAVLTLRFNELIGLHGSAGLWFFRLTMFAEAALLFVAAQAGFIDGPRVMANMASDSWLPHRFAQLSDRLTMQYGVLLISLASILTLLYTRGDTSTLVLMYSINVFLTFSLSESGMVRYWLRHRRKYPDWKRHIVIHVVGLALCLTILVMNVAVKFTEGGWITLAVTSALIALCFVIRRHYGDVQNSLKRLDTILGDLPTTHDPQEKPLDPAQPTAVMLVGGYGGLGIHTMLTVQRLFPGHFKNWIFVSVGVIDSATFKGQEEVDEVRSRTEKALKRYVSLARSLGLTAEYRMDIGTEAVTVAQGICAAIASEFPRAIFFAGKLVFERERWYQRILHNETAYALQRRLQLAGMNAMVLPVRVMEETTARAA